MIISDNPSGIESLLKKSDFTVPGFSGHGIAVIRKLRNVFGEHTTVKQAMTILHENPILVDELNQFGQFKVIYGST